MPLRSLSIPIFLLTIFLFNEEPHDNNMSLARVHINGGSYLIVHGKTNLTKFRCQYLKSLSDTLFVRIVNDETEELILENASISLGVTEFDCGNKLINKDFQKLMRVVEFPELKVEALGIRLNKDDQIRGNSNQHGAVYSVNTRITIAGKQNDYLLEVEELANASPDTYSGSLHLNIRDFGLTPPRKFLGLMKVQENVDIDFYLKLSFLD